MNQSIINDYQQRAQAAQSEFTKYEKLANQYSLLRLVVFGLIVVSIYFAVIYNNIFIFLGGLVVLGFVFAWLVSKQSGFEKLKQYYKDLNRVTENEISVITTRANLYDNGSAFSDDKHFYTADLDIFGNLSLFQMLNRAATFAGRSRLAAWLSKPSVKYVILERQEAVQEIGTKNTWKLDNQARLLFAIKEPVNHLEQLITYLHYPLNLKGEAWLSKYAKIAPWLLLTAIILSGYYYPAKILAVLIGFANMSIVFSKAMYIQKTDLIAGKIGQTLGNYAGVFEKIEQENWHADYNNKLADTIKNDGTSARIKELSTLINKLNYHLNIYVGFFLNLFLLWDIRQIIAIENWKRNNRQNLEKAFNVITEFEALMSLSSLYINNPEWAFPQIADGEGYTLVAQQIAHPLINPEQAVKNDYALHDTFKIDIITGSNMAGKSTFLRTIGINTVLALCGAPVCAESMEVSVITMVSYMRIKDSLNESTSTFKAELDRLQMLLAAVESDEKIFFLIDEMLRGTNSVDKYLGSKAVIEQLINKKGVGLVATHDLQIAHLEQKYPDYIRNFYFDIQVSDGEMLFDYKIKNGECKTFNASMLLKRIGIEIEA
ncbi:MutS-related protein [Mucilaginibacter jinjuensis]|uniref:DNA mismatch repair protein MutS n=1 Tax=Mucilaginibacter jinjuensis TaxID=1176721 RepID=A0ABY7TDH0_9SPHI|nr:DNA mismatch repair protein MutS [Mucilaginibacter jinjuensis]WCT14570.1 DNA mismatch repair protein MutS [Mucilaginibacter jinjuensis]